MPEKYVYQLNVTEKLNFQEIPDWLREITQKIRQSGFKVYLVGGAVRDLLCGVKPDDWDLATEALPDDIELIFEKTIPSGKTFGTITILEGAHQVQITTFREDLFYQDGRRPETVRFTKDIIKDLERRDFTINALAYDMEQDILIDPFGGHRDLKNQLLKTVGNPHTRFTEDALRMFRFFRFLATMDLKADWTAKKAINPLLAKNISYERIRDEFNKLLVGKYVRKSLEGMYNSGLLQSIIPELELKEAQVGSPWNRNLWEHLLKTTETIHPSIHLRWAALLHDIAKPKTKFTDEKGIHFYGHDRLGAEMARNILERLRYPKKLIETVNSLINWHMFDLPLNASDAAIRKFVAKVGKTLVPDLLELRRADIVGTGNISYQTWQYWNDFSQRIIEILDYDNTISVNKLDINGRIIMNHLNLPPGPIIGEILEYLLKKVIEDPSLNVREDLLQIADNYYQQIKI